MVLAQFAKNLMALLLSLANAMEEAWQNELAKKRRLVAENDTDKLQRSIKEAENFKHFLAGIPSMLASLRTHKKQLEHGAHEGLNEKQLREEREREIVAHQPQPLHERSVNLKTVVVRVI